MESASSNGPRSRRDWDGDRRRSYQSPSGSEAERRDREAERIDREKDTERERQKRPRQRDTEWDRSKRSSRSASAGCSRSRRRRQKRRSGRSERSDRRKRRSPLRSFSRSRSRYSRSGSPASNSDCREPDRLRRKERSDRGKKKTEKHRDRDRDRVRDHRRRSDRSYSRERRYRRRRSNDRYRPYPDDWQERDTGYDSRKIRRRRSRSYRRQRYNPSYSRSASLDPNRGRGGGVEGAAVAHHRTGVVSDDDDIVESRRHGERPVRSHQSSRVASKRLNSESTAHDDSVGHFKGGQGALIANRYRVIQEVGIGTFGRVLECLDLKRSRSNQNDREAPNNLVAIKVVRDIKRYHESALIEAQILRDVNRRGGRGVSHCGVMHDSFSFSGHYCLVFENLGPSLYDFLKRHNYRPFHAKCIRDFAQQLLETLDFLDSMRLIHTDLKPENVLLLDRRERQHEGFIVPESTRIKVIDFGGATYDSEKKSSVVNTRQYRAPEVILGVGWSMPSDMWSIGCILAECYQGELLFATHDNAEHLALIEQIIGPFSRRMLGRARNLELTNKVFDDSGVHRMAKVLPSESLNFVKRVKPLEAIVHKKDDWFLNLLRRSLVIDPDERATASECLRFFELR